MNSENSAIENRAMPRFMVIFSMVVTVLVIAFLGTFFYLHQRLQSKANRIVMMMEARNKSLQTTPAQKAIAISRAHILRDKWRPWALSHKAELQRMLYASSGDPAAMQVVWEALPMRLGNASGITTQDLHPDGGDDPFLPSAFGWSPDDKLPFNEVTLRLVHDPKVREQLKKGHQRLAQIRQDNFAAERDIVIASAMPGRTCQIHLWASGRITEQTLSSPEQKRDMALKHGGQIRASDWFGPHQELQSPYDFLKS